MESEVPFADANRDLRVAGADAGDEVRHEAGRERHRTAHEVALAKQPFVAHPRAPDRAFGVVDHMAGDANGGVPGIRQRGLARACLEELDLQLVLEIADLAREGWLGHAQ